MAGTGNTSPSRSVGRHRRDQQGGLDALFALSSPVHAITHSHEEVGHARFPDGRNGSDLDYRRDKSRRGRSNQNIFPARKRVGGALASHYDIPAVHLRRRRLPLYISTAILITVAELGRHIMFVWSFRTERPLMAIWAVSFLFSGLQWLLSWGDKPFNVSPEEQVWLDRLQVVVNVPLYNEDPQLIDRCLYSIVSQSRPPAIINVVDDGSDIDYRDLARHWNGVWPRGVEVVWTRQRNQGKKHAQTVTFTSFPEADIFVTIDSDTALEQNALDEGLKPFIHRRVMSVAGIELAFNSEKNWLTRTVSARSQIFQLVACGTQSMLGDVLVNRGAYALYRSDLIHRIVSSYIGEKFWGRPVRLGDDAALTLFARGSGWAIQQPTAFALTMYPEKMSHHFRQWLRWMRGSTIRNFWRMRYLPLTSYGWWFTVIGIQTFLASLALPVVIVYNWPASAPFTAATLLAMFGWSYLIALRTLAIHRSDENWLVRIGTILSYPAAMFWATFVLRPIRVLGIATFMRQGWTTRTEGTEVALDNSLQRETA